MNCCSFCGKTEEEVKLLVRGRTIEVKPNEGERIYCGYCGEGVDVDTAYIDAFICDACIDVCNEILADSKK